MNTLVNYRIDEQKLDDVNAGTFTPNLFPMWAYRHAGFKCEAHFFDPDVFYLDGKKYSHDEANEIMKEMGYYTNNPFNNGNVFKDGELIRR